MLQPKLKFLEAATMALSADQGNDPGYYLPGLSYILEEIGNEAQEMFQKLYGNG